MRLCFAIARSVEHAETPAALERFGAQLGYAVGESVRVEQFGSYGALRRALASGAAQLGWMPPVVLAEDAYAYGLEPLVTSQRNGSTRYCSVLFTRADTSIQVIGDLRGRTVAWVDRCSAAGYLLPRLHLAAEGLNLNTLFKRELFLGSHGAVVRAVFDGRADVGATYGGPPGADDADGRSGFADVAPGRPVRVLFRTAAVAADAVVCDARLPAPLRDKLTAALCHLGTFAIGRRVTRLLFGADGFRPADAAGLHELRTLVSAARERGWLSDL